MTYVEPTQDGSPQKTSASDDGREMVRELMEEGVKLADGLEREHRHNARYAILNEHCAVCASMFRLAAIHAKAKEWLEGKG